MISDSNDRIMRNTNEEIWIEIEREYMDFISETVFPSCRKIYENDLKDPLVNKVERAKQQFDEEVMDIMRVCRDDRACIEKEMFTLIREYCRQIEGGRACMNLLIEKVNSSAGYQVYPRQ